MSEKRNLVHWSILALHDCTLPLASVRHFFPVCINAFCKFSFAYYSFIKSRFWQAAFLFLLLIIRQRTFLPVFAKMTPDAVVSTRCWRNPFSLPSTTGKCSKCQTPGQKNSLLAYYYNRQGAKWPGAEPDNKKSSKSFSRLTAFAGRVGGGWYSVFMTCPVVRQAGT